MNTALRPFSTSGDSVSSMVFPGAEELVQHRVRFTDVGHRPLIAWQAVVLNLA